MRTDGTSLMCHWSGYQLHCECGNMSFLPLLLVAQTLESQGSVSPFCSACCCWLITWRLVLIIAPLPVHQALPLLLSRSG